MKDTNTWIYVFVSAAEVDASLKWIIDLTIAYPNGNPLDIMTIFLASAPPCSVVFHYRCYPISEVIISFFLNIIIIKVQS